MLERDVGANFNSLFREYAIHSPINNAQSGWPDRLIQLDDSRIIAVELKYFQLLKSGKLRLIEFRSSQAAWLAKWQRAEGKCFLFMGITDFYNKFIGYGILTVDNWREWISLSDATIDPSELSLISNDSEFILNWFRDYAEFTYA